MPPERLSLAVSHLPSVARAVFPVIAMCCQNFGRGVVLKPLRCPSVLVGCGWGGLWLRAVAASVLAAVMAGCRRARRLLAVPTPTQARPWARRRAYLPEIIRLPVECLAAAAGGALGAVFPGAGCLG